MSLFLHEFDSSSGLQEALAREALRAALRDSRASTAASLLLNLGAAEQAVAAIARKLADLTGDGARARLLDAMACHAELTLRSFACASAPVDDAAPSSEAFAFQLLRSLALVDELAGLAREQDRQAFSALCERWIEERGRLLLAWSACNVVEGVDGRDDRRGTGAGPAR
jgi:hypothetical protein